MIVKDRISKVWPLTPPWTDDPNNIRLHALPRVRFYSSLEPAESCGVATFGIEGMDMAKLADHLFDKWGIVVSPMKHPGGLIDGIRIVVNVSLSAREIDYFADVMEGIIKKGALG